MNYQQPVAQQIQVPQSIKNVGTAIGNVATNVKTTLNNTFSQFSQSTEATAGASSQFLQSNTIIAKFVFLIFAVLAFLFLLYLGIALIDYFTSPPVNPYLVKGMISGAFPMIIPQDPKASGYVQLQRSNNQTTGLEFTWSTWIFLNDLGTNTNQYQHIFNKGDTNFNAQNVSNVNNAPGLYLGPASNNLHIIMDTTSTIDKNNTIDISNIPIKKWVNVVIRMENTVLDVYINGVITSRLVFQSVPKQNYNDVNVCQKGGFSGNLSDLRYFNYALSVFDINSIVAAGPNTTMNSTAVKQNQNYTYLASSWYPQ
jgi:hypothetical protein